jgi:processing peptidase subunit beta
LVGDKLSFMPASPKTSKREASQYVGGEVRNLTEDNTLSLALMF